MAPDARCPAHARGIFRKRSGLLVSMAAGLALLLFAWEPVPVGAKAPAHAPAAHVILISIDGLKPDSYLGRGAIPPQMPVVDALEKRGSYAEGVIAQLPALTYVGHTSIATGDLPIHHGIYENTLFDPVTGPSRMWHFQASAIKVPAIWDVANAAGLTTAAASWPVTVGAHITYLFPETNQAPQGSTWLDLARRESTPGLVDAVVKKLGGFSPNGNRDPIQRDRFTTAAAVYMIETWRPSLLLVHLVEADYAQHAHGPWSPAAKTALEHLDARIGRIVQAADHAGIASSTVFLVTGDHGFTRARASFQPNVVLKQAGLLHVDAKGRITSWQAIAHGAGIRLKNPHDQAVAARVVKLFRDLANGRYRGLLHVVGRRGIARLGGDPNLLLFLDPAPGYMTDAGTTGGVLVRAREEGAHGFLPTRRDMYTGLVLAGPGVRQGVVMPIARQIDIAPTVARLLGIAMHGTDGVPMVGVLQRAP